MGLERSIDVAYQIASQRLFDVFVDKYRLLDHLLALKHYLLLGYGDFADQLMDTLGYDFLYAIFGLLLTTPFSAPACLVPQIPYIDTT